MASVVASTFTTKPCAVSRHQLHVIARKPCPFAVAHSRALPDRCWKRAPQRFWRRALFAPAAVPLLASRFQSTGSLPRRTPLGGQPGASPIALRSRIARSARAPARAPPPDAPLFSRDHGRCCRPRWLNLGAVQRDPFESEQTFGAQHAQHLRE